MTHHVAIVDTGGANIASLRFALERLGANTLLTVDRNELRSASHVILPGVGAAMDAMRRLESLELIETIKTLTQPVLGICLGMQLLAEFSEEQGARCLGITKDRTEQLLSSEHETVPHMGWNNLHNLKPADPLLEGVSERDHFYFVHSFAIPDGPSTIASCNYTRSFAAIIRRENFCGTQFHPERSSRAGARILDNFLAQT